MNSRALGLHLHKVTVPNKMQYFFTGHVNGEAYNGVPKVNALADRNKVLSILHETK